MLETFLLGALQVAILSIMEPVLSIDNVLILAILTKLLPKEKQPPKPFQNLFWGGQKDAALKAGIWFSYIARIGLFFLVVVVLGKYPLAEVVINILGGSYLSYLTIKHFFGEENDQKPKGNASTNFWIVLALVEGNDLLFGLDSFTSAYAFSHNIYVLACATIIGVAFVRFGAQIARPLIEERYPKLEDAAFLLIGGVALILFIDTPLEYFKHIASPEWIKIVLAGAILTPYLIHGEITYRIRRRLEREANPERRVSIQPQGKVLDGFFMRGSNGATGVLQLQLYKPDLMSLNANTAIVVDASRSMGPYFAHSLNRVSKIERIIRSLSKTIASYDDDGNVEVILCSLENGQTVKSLGAYSAEELRKMKISLTGSVPGEESRIVPAIEQAYRILSSQKEVNYCHIIVISDCDLTEDDDTARDELTTLKRYQEFISRQIRQKKMIPTKVEIICLKPEYAEPLYKIDNPPDAENDDPDVFNLVVVHGLKQAMKSYQKLFLEGLETSYELATQKVGRRARLLIDDVVFYDSRESGPNGVPGVLKLSHIPSDINEFVFEMDGESTRVKIPD